MQTFMRWINCHLAQRDLKVEDLRDLTDGVALINLLEVLTGDHIEKWYKKPKNRTYAITNNAIALAFMSKHNINLVNCSAQGILCYIDRSLTFKQLSLMESIQPLWELYGR